VNKNRVETGQNPPDFTLQDTHGEFVTLSDFRGKKNIYLIFNRGFA